MPRILVLKLVQEVGEDLLVRRDALLGGGGAELPLLLELLLALLLLLKHVGQVGGPLSHDSLPPGHGGRQLLNLRGRLLGGDVLLERALQAGARPLSVDLHIRFAM